MSSNQDIEVMLDAESIVIRVSKQYLAHCAAPAAFDSITGYENAKVINETQLIQDVLAELKREDEDGTTLVHIALDDAIRNAFDQGSEAFADDESCDADHDFGDEEEDEGSLL